MALRVGIYYDASRDAELIYVAERRGDTEYALEPAGDGLVSFRPVERHELRKPFLHIDGSIGRDLLPALVEALAERGYRAKDPETGVLPVIKETLSDARTMRDRLFTLVERLAGKP